MTSKQDRIGRILAIRTRELEEHVARLLPAQQQEASATAELERALQDLEQAIAARREITERATLADALIESDEWLAVKSYCVEVSRHKLLRAQRVRSRIQVEVLRARDKIRQLEKLQARLTAREKLQNDRRERREHDEMAAQLRRRVHEG